MKYSVSQLTLTLLIAMAPSVAPAMLLSGTVHHDSQGEYADFDLTLGSESLKYRVKGNSTPDMGFTHTATDLSGIKVFKSSVDKDGRTRLQDYRNDGTVHVYFKARELERVALAGLNVEGEYFRGMFIPNRKFPNLVIDGKRSQGELSYNIFNGHYDAKRGLSFGALPVASAVAGSRMVLNYDNLPLGYNRTKVQMRLGSLLVRGQINYTDIKRTFSDGDGDTTEYTIARTGRYHLTVSKLNGAEPTFAAPGEQATADDVSAQHLFAMFQLLEL